jgi:hypothetical protein
MSVLNLFALWSTTIRRRRHEVASDVVVNLLWTVWASIYALFGWSAWSKSTVDASYLSISMFHLLNYWTKFRWKFWDLCQKLPNKSSGNAQDLYSGGDRFESLPGHCFDEGFSCCYNTSVITQTVSFQILSDSSFIILIDAIESR